MTVSFYLLQIYCWILLHVQSVHLLHMTIRSMNSTHHLCPLSLAWSSSQCIQCKHPLWFSSKWGFLELHSALDLHRPFLLFLCPLQPLIMRHTGSFTGAYQLRGSRFNASRLLFLLLQFNRLSTLPSSGVFGPEGRQVFLHASVDSLSVRCHMDQGIESLTNQLVAEGEALCLEERHRFHAESSHRCRSVKAPAKSSVFSSI